MEEDTPVDKIINFLLTLGFLLVVWGLGIKFILIILFYVIGEKP